MQTYDLSSFMMDITSRNPGEPMFVQAVEEFATEVIPFINANPEYQGYALLERLTEPDRTISFKVTWQDDKNQVRVNKGYRVQFNNAIGPYKGGLRFHPSVNLGILKFLGFEQIFKNSLTSLAMGGAKGGSDFDPKGCSDNEVMRFCQAFMTELAKHIGSDTDVPAGDIGVGGREIGYLYGKYRKLKNENTGVITGKGVHYGGSLIRPEATGYGCVYITVDMLKAVGESIEGKTCLVSGSGNVAQFCAEKVIELGGKVISLSDSGGTVHIPDGLTNDQLEWVKVLKNEKRGRISEFASEFGLVYLEGKKPWSIPCYVAFPCATQNEIDAHDAQTMVDNGCKFVAEGANMPVDNKGIAVFQKARIGYIPGKASNAGGVATSGLEMAQNSQRQSWSREKVDDELKKIMMAIHDKCELYGKGEDGRIDYVKGANIAGFVKVAQAVIAQGVL